MAKSCCLRIQSVNRVFPLTLTMKITGPNAFERSYTLEGTGGEHEAAVIGHIVSRMVPGKKG